VSGLFAKTLRDQQRALIGWGIGLAAVAAMYSAFYPSIKDSAGDFQSYLENLPDAVRNVIGGDFTTPAGYLRSETFSSLGPILFLVFAIGAGARAIAGEEEAGTLDLLLSTPIRRRQLLVDKIGAMVATATALAAVLFVTLWALGPTFDLTVPAAHLAAACLMLLLLGLAFGAIALAIGCATGHRGLALGTTGGLAVLTFIVNAIAPSVDALGWARPLSPFRWYLDPDPLVDGVSLENVLVLATISVIAWVAAEITFQRRDLAA
jgi:beta-exotoxin I transport system permease protein